MSQTDIFDSETVVPDPDLAQRAGTLLGFQERYARVHDQLRLLLAADKLGDWSQRHHRRHLAIADLVADQYPLVVFHGDVGTGKTAMAECIAAEEPDVVRECVDPRVGTARERHR